MSSSPGSREVAVRLFASEFDDATLSYSESDEERAPNYVVSPTGARINRLFVAGVLTETERINEDTLRARIVDPSGAFVTYAGQYQPDEQAFLDQTTPPEFVALTGKARTFQPEDSDRVFTSVRPESINAVDADTRDRWIVTAAETTLNRLAVFDRALESDLRGDDLEAALEAGGAPPALAAGIPRALDHYRTSPAYVEAVRQLAVDALEMVTGDREEVRVPEIAPDGGGHTDVGPLPDTDVTIDAEAITAEDATEDDVAEDEPEAESDVDEAEADVDETEDEVDESEDEVAEPEVEAETSEEAEDEVEVAEAETESETVEAEPDTEPETIAAKAESDELGDFDGGGTDFGTDAESETDESESETDESEADADDPPTQEDVDVGDEMYEMDEEERQEIEEEFGTDFSTGTEVDEPGEADIDVPEPDDLAEMEESERAEQPEDSETEDVEAEETDEADEADDADEGDGADDVDLEEAVVDVMEDLDEGDGATRDEVVDAAVERFDADADDVEEAIQGALMSGKCYEPGENTLKAI